MEPPNINYDYHQGSLMIRFSLLPIFARQRFEYEP